MATEFVDREDTMDVIGSVVRKLVERSGSVLVLKGDSGMDKTSLLAEVRRRWSGGPCRVVLVSCVPGLGRGGEYGPFLDALDAHLPVAGSADGGGPARWDEGLPPPRRLCCP